MQFSEHWLRTYIDPPIGTEELAHRLTMAGLEVESIEPVAPAFEGVVVANVLSVSKHPNADKLSVCQVDAGTGSPLSIVCGAPNVAAGIRVPCALPGAVLPGDFKIKPTTMRGVESQGMLCSARELGLSEDQGGLLLLSAEAPIGQPIRQWLDLDDHRLDIKLTPNRPDALSVTGVAREVAALTGAKINWPSFVPVPPVIDDRLHVDVQASDLCGRFSGRVIRDVDARAPTPDWMKQRLERSGQRPISALVDISNYVMLELGRPTHVFDLDRVRGSLQVRWGRAGEQVLLLNGQTVEVDSNVGVIADDGGVEALAGVMGGDTTAVSLETRNVYVEAAFWWPDAIRGRARRYNFSTDAAHRFERGVDFATTVDHLEYITRLILEICSGKPGPVDDTVLNLPKRSPVRLRLARARKLLGVGLAAADIADAFTRLGFTFQFDEQVFVVTPPSYRFDIEIEEDLVEEVARIYGFDRIPALPPLARVAMRAQRESVRTAHQLRNELAWAGFQEVINFSFIDDAAEREFTTNTVPIKVLNPIASHLSVMRSGLISGLVSTLKYNLNRKAGRVRIFEIGRIFFRDASVIDDALSVAGIRQPMRVAGLAYGSADDEQWGVASRDVDFFDIKGEVEHLFHGLKVRFVNTSHPALHPGRSAQVQLNGTTIGWLGELHPRLLQSNELPKAPCVFELDLEPLLSIGLPSYQEVPKFQALSRDISVTVDEATPLQALVDAVESRRLSDPSLAQIIEFRVFDVYRAVQADSSKVAEADANVLLIKEKNLAFRVVLQDTGRPVNDEQADAAVAAVVQALEQDCGARLRK